jgi:Fic family protein
MVSRIPAPMKLPRPPPDADEAFHRLLEDPKALTRVLSSPAYSATVGGKYIHWDELRFRTLAPTLREHTEWWTAIKFARRSIYRTLPFFDSKSKAFRLAIPDPLQRQLSEIDRDLSGRVSIPEQLTTPGSRDRYLISALIEEAITSSQLEGASTTRKVARDMLRSGRQPRDKHERMIYNNFAAMRFVSTLAKQELTPDLIYEVHRRVTDGTLEDPEDAGRLRDEPVSVISDGLVLHDAPPAAQLPERIERFCAFANERSPGFYIHPVVRAALLHFFLGYDHPFADGNGRTARALFYWSMLRSGYWLCEFVSISHILRKAPTKYARAFLYTETDDNDTTYFVLYHLAVLGQAIRALHDYVSLKMKAMERTRSLIRQGRHFNYRQLALLGHALGNPDAQYTVTSHANSHQVVRQTARTDLNELVRLGLLQAAPLGNGQVYFPQPDLEERLQQFGSEDVIPR